MAGRSFAKRLLARLVLLMFAATSCTLAAFAQTTQFTYQGKLTDSGSPANSSYDFQLKLYDTVTLGTGIQQGSTLTLTGVTVTNGIFTVQLDFGACASCFNGAPRFLEIAVKLTSGSTFTTLGPRQPVTSTPYALKSLNATVADGLSVACVNCVTSSQIDSVSGSDITGTIPVASIPAGSASYIQNTTTQQASSNFNISGNGALGGSLGIGTTSPSERMEVAGNVRVYPSSGPGSLAFRNRTNADYSQVVFLDNGNTYRGYLGYIGSMAGLGSRNNTVEFGSNGTDISFQPDNTEVMRLTLSGRVIIGAGPTSPSVTLDAKNNAFGGTAVYGFATGNTGFGVIGQADTGTSPVGVSGSSVGGGPNSRAGYFFGAVEITGPLIKPAGSFKIDHPLDPANKYLYHSFVESPDMMNIYDGNVTTDASGEAEVTLPDWFEALNKDFRYQLTVIGTFAQAMVAEEIKENRFKIKTSLPSVKVSWQVTGIRHDAYADQHRIPVEESKSKEEQGSYLHPEVFGQPDQKGVEWRLHPEMMKQMKAQREKLQKKAP